jgi:hypothetical protein
MNTTCIDRWGSTISLLEEVYRGGRRGGELGDFTPSFFAVMYSVIQISVRINFFLVLGISLKIKVHPPCQISGSAPGIALASVIWTTTFYKLVFKRNILEDSRPIFYDNFLLLISFFSIVCWIGLTVGCLIIWVTSTSNGAGTTGMIQLIILKSGKGVLEGVYLLPLLK